VTLSPQVFLGQIPCSGEAGALQSYVATLTDITPNLATPSFVLPSSRPVPCSNNVVFRYIVGGHVYQAAIDGYDVAAADLVPLGPGARTMLRRNGTTAVEPRWKASCGDSSGEGGSGLTASPDRDIPFAAEDCTPFSGKPDGITAIQVDPRASLGPLACVNDQGSGEIDRFDITPGASPAPSAPALPPYLNVDCASGENGLVKYQQGILPDATYTFALVAYRAGGEKLEASCVARTREGLTVTAVCDPLLVPHTP
jgi:hypothetical protein